jgi:hypothetical protein
MRPPCIPKEAEPELQIDDGFQAKVKGASVLGCQVGTVEAAQEVMGERE